MATYLYRLGRFAARRAWLVILVWGTILALVGGAAGVLSRPLSSQLTIPGTEFQTVLDDLKAHDPDAGGGNGSVLFRTADGQPFTKSQRADIESTMKQWRRMDHVTSARNPFTTQRDLDDSADDVADGRDKLNDGKDEIRKNTKKLDDAEKKLDKGEKDLAKNAKKLAQGKTQLAQGQAQASAGQQEISANAAKLAAGKSVLDQNAEKLAAGQEELDLNAAQIAAGKNTIATNQRKIDQGREQLSEARTTLALNQQKLDSGQQQLDQLAPLLKAAKGLLGEIDKAQEEGRLDEFPELNKKATCPKPAPTDLEGLRACVAQTVQGLKAQVAKSDQAQRQLDAGQKKLNAGKKQVAAAQKNLDAGQKKLDAGRKRLEAGEKKLNAGQAQLSNGEKQLANGRTKLSDGEKQLAQGQAQADAGQAEIDKNRAKLEAGDEQVQDGRQSIADGRKEVADGRDKLADARKKIADNEVKLERGERQVALIDGMRTVNEDGNVAVAQIAFDVAPDQLDAALLDAIKDQGAGLSRAGVLVDYSNDLTDKTGELAGPGEIIGVAVAGLVLLVMLGSLLAAGLPLLTALVGVGVGLLGALTLTHWIDLAQVTPILALMLGLAVGIDYALFLVNRHRQQLADGVELEESIGRATGTAGNAVTVAGLTVIVALAALTFAGIPFLGTMGLVAAATVAVAVLLSLTLTPALLRVIGPRVLSRRGRRRLQARHAQDSAAQAEDDRGGAHGRGWGGLVTRHPVITAVLGVVLLGTLAIPAQALRLGLPDGSSEPDGSSAYTTYSVIADEFGAGQNAAVIAVAQVPGKMAREMTSGERTDLSLDIAERLRDTSDVAYVVPAGYSDDHTRALFQIIPKTGPSDEATTTLVNDLRDARGQIVDDTGIRSLGFAGQTVANIDMSQLLSDALPTYLAIVVGISLLLLLLVFRSVVVPLLATAGFLLSIAAAFGSVVAVFQWGWLGSVFKVDHPGPILSFLPTLAIGIVFGLAMDYQMFLVSGMREAWAHGHTARGAVRAGFSQGARVVTAAALIMTSVFISFVFSPQTMIRPIGFALATGVLLDAFVVRMTLMPAFMHLLGEKAWYIPRWLDRRLPNLDVEGAQLARQREQSAGSAGSADTAEPAGADGAPTRTDSEAVPAT